MLACNLFVEIAMVAVGNSSCRLTILSISLFVVKYLTILVRFGTDSKVWMSAGDWSQSPCFCLSRLSLEASVCLGKWGPSMAPIGIACSSLLPLISAERPGDTATETTVCIQKGMAVRVLVTQWGAHLSWQTGLLVSTLSVGDGIGRASGEGNSGLVLSSRGCWGWCVQPSFTRKETIAACLLGRTPGVFWFEFPVSRLPKGPWCKAPFKKDPCLEYNASISWSNEWNPRTAFILFEKIEYAIKACFVW